MGLERVLQAAAVVAAIASAAAAAPEPVGIIDVSPTDGWAHQQIARALVDAGLEVWTADNGDQALVGIDVTPDGVELVNQLTIAMTAYAKLDCVTTTKAAKQAIGLLSARQAAGLPSPELSKAWAYVLLCADKGGDTTSAMVAASRVRATGGTIEIPEALLNKYPEVDALLDRQIFKLEIGADIAGADIWVDGTKVGTAPVTVHVLAGEHVIAAAKGDRRGFAAGTASAAQSTLVVPTQRQVNKYKAVATRVSSWGGEMPAGSQIKLILDATKLRVVIVRRGDALEAWGRAGRAEEPRKLGGEDGAGTLDEKERLASLIAERVAAWNDRAPDPDQELLVETSDDRVQRTLLREKKTDDEPAKWWVYGALIGAGVLGGALLYFTESSDPVQRIEVHVP